MYNKAVTFDARIYPDHLKTQEICEKAGKKCLFSLIYVPDQYKNQQMCEMVVSGFSAML